MATSQDKMQSNYQDFIKLLAICTMIIDHYGFFFLPQNLWLRVIGRIAMPLFCFFSGYNFKQIPRFSILISAIIIYIYSALILKTASITNILPTIFIGQCYLYLFKSKAREFNSVYLQVIILCLIWNCSWYFSDYLIVSDYGTFGIAIILLGYAAKTNPLNFKTYLAISLALTFFYTFTVMYLTSNYFTLWHLAGCAILLSLLYFLVNYKDLMHLIKYDLRIITRHSLLIYCLNILISHTIFLKFIH